MDENNTKNELNNASEPVSEQKKEPKRKSKDGNKKTFTDWLNEYKGEFRKITWPSKKDLYKQTITVIFISLIVGVLIFGMDTVYNVGYNWLVSMFS